jgi:hypothetical protein
MLGRLPGEGAGKSPQASLTSRSARTIPADDLRKDAVEIALGRAALLHGARSSRRNTAPRTFS